MSCNSYDWFLCILNFSASPCADLLRVSSTCRLESEPIIRRAAKEDRRQLPARLPDALLATRRWSRSLLQTLPHTHPERITNPRSRCMTMIA